MCECKTKIQFEIDGGSLLNIEPLEDSDCMSFDECLWCTEIKDNLEDGTYTADLLCEVYPVKYSEGIEYDGENAVENITKLELD